MTAVVSVKLTEPQFEGQTKTKLGNASMRTAVARVVNDELGTYFEENPKEARELIIKCISAQRAREAARSARELTRRKGVFETTTLPASLPTAPRKTPLTAKFISSRATAPAARRKWAETAVFRRFCR